MKRIFMVFIIVMQIFLLLTSSSSFQEELNTEQNNQGDMEEQDYLLSEDGFFLKKLRPRNLSPLSKYDKITWSFKIARKHSFL